MLPNKLVAVSFAALLAVQVVPGTAHAQLTGNFDLVVSLIDPGRPRIAGIEAPLNITVTNQGSANFPGTTGWQIFVGLNGKDINSCIENGGNAAAPINPATSPCFRQVRPNSAEASIRAGESKTYSILWNADPSTDGNSSAIIHAEIMPFGATNPGEHPDSCAGPDGAGPESNCVNNQASLTGVFIGILGVRAQPTREPSPSAGGDINAAWKNDEVQENCPIAPSVVARACKIRAGRTLVATYQVTNTGTVHDAYTPDLQGSQDTLNYYNSRGYVFGYAPQNFSLGAGQSRDVRVTIFIPLNETAGNQTNINSNTLEIRWSSQRTGTVHTDLINGPGCASNDLYCRDPSIPGFRVEPRREFNVTYTRLWNETFSRAAGTYEIDIRNMGNADDAFNVSFDLQSRTINDSWTPTVNSHTVVGKNETERRVIQVTPPDNATNGTYYFDITIKSFGDVDGDAPCVVWETRVDGLFNPVRGDAVCRMRFVVHLKQDWNMTGFGDVPARVVPGTPVTYNLGIRNNGNGYDNVSLDLQTTVFGWDVRLSNRTIALTPDNTTTFTLTVTSPPNTVEGTIGAFYINATAGGPIDVGFDQRSKATIESLMTISRGPNIRLEAPMNTSFVDAGAAVEYNIVVTNVGNVADNFTIPTPERPSDWAVTVEPEHLELQPLQQGNVKVTLRAPSAANVGEKATAIARVRSSVDRTLVKDIALEARVSGPDLFVDNVLVNATSPYSGDPLEVTVVLGNTGNKANNANTTLRLYFVQGGVERLVGNKSYDALSIGGQRRLTETFLWDTQGVEGAGVILARIDVDNTVKEIDESSASNERTRPVTLRTFSIKLTPAQGLSARPGEELTYSEAPNVFVVEYNGNQASEPVTILFESENGWLASDAEINRELPRGSAISIPAKLAIPALPGTARDTLSITVTLANRPEERLRASAVTTILDEEKPIIRAIRTIPETVKLGDALTIEAQLEDATGLTSATAYVTFPTNETSAVTLVKVAPDTFRGERTFTVAGRYRVAVEAIDAADPPNKNDTRLPLGSFVVSPGSAPTIKLAAGQSNTIRTGAPIALDIRDPLGIAKANYNIKGVNYDLRGPGYQIDTSTFQTGPITLTVRAENIYGVTTSANFSFVVDNTAPGITRVTMNPDRPKAREDLTITITTEAKVESVEVLIKRDGQVIETLNATKRGIGSFVVTYNPPEGDYRIDVTARDAAGNTKLAEGAVVFSAKPGSFVPGAPLAALIAGLAAIALALRRRK